MSPLTLQIAIPRRFLGLVLSVVLFNLVTPPAIAQTEMIDDPGFVDMREIENWFESAPVLEVDVRGKLLNLVAEASRPTDPELSLLLGNLKAIQVKGFPMHRRQMDGVSRHTRAFVRRLSNDGWDPVIHVRERDKQIDMFVKMKGDDIAGLMVIVLEPGDDETVFLNIVGNIDPEQIGRIGRKFDVGYLGDF